MKILIVTLEYPPMVGGIASYVYNFVAHLPAKNVAVYAPAVNSGIEFDQNNSWKVFRRRPYWILWPRWFRMFFQIWRICKRDSITELHVHHALPVGYVAWLIKKILKIPYTLFLHGTDLELTIHRPFKRRRLLQVARNATQIIVNSQFLKEKLTRYFDEFSKIKVIYPCPADSFFEPISTEKIFKLKTRLALEGKKVIITVARMAEGKGYPHFLRLLPEIIRQIPNVVWLVIGDGPKRTAIIEQVQKLYLQNVLRYEGSVPYKELPIYLQMADLFVLLTHPDEIHEEGFGTVFLEAAASGIPVVAGRVGGVEEAVEHLVTGMVVDVHQEKAVVGDIVGLLKNPTYAKQMGEAGKTRAIREFTWEKQIKKFGIL